MCPSTSRLGTHLTYRSVTPPTLDGSIGCPRGRKSEERLHVERGGTLPGPATGARTAPGPAGPGVRPAGYIVAERAERAESSHEKKGRRIVSTARLLE